MNNTNRSFKPVILLGSLIGCFLIFNSCTSSRHNEKVMSKWVNWEIIFKENASEEAKAKDLVNLKKYILKYLGSEENSANIISVTFSNTVPSNLGKDRGLIIINVGFGLASTGAYSTVKPPPPPPVIDLFRSIRDIMDRR